MNLPLDLVVKGHMGCGYIASSCLGKIIPFTRCSQNTASYQARQRVAGANALNSKNVDIDWKTSLTVPFSGTELEAEATDSVQPPSAARCFYD